MRRPFLTIALSVALAAGGFLPTRTVYQCSSTGKRSVGRCCCAPAVDVSRPSCPACSRRSCAGLVGLGGEGAESPPGSRGGFQGASSARSGCCTVTLEKEAAKDRSSSHRESEWKRLLTSSRLIVSSLFLHSIPEPAGAPGSAGRPRRANPPAPRPGAPIFISHCALLL